MGAPVYVEKINHDLFLSAIRICHVGKLIPRFFQIKRIVSIISGVCKYYENKQDENKIRIWANKFTENVYDVCHG